VRARAPVLRPLARRRLHRAPAAAAEVEWWEEVLAEEDAAAAELASTSADTIGWGSLLSDVASHASTALGHRYVLETRPCDTLEASIDALDETSAVDALMTEYGVQLNFGGAQTGQVESALSRVRKRGVMSPSMVGDVGNFLQVSGRLQESILKAGRGDEDREGGRAVQPLKEVALSMTPFEALSKRFRLAVDDEGQLKDGASPELKAARQRRSTCYNRARKAVGGGGASEYNGRLCVEVPATSTVPRGHLVLGSRAGMLCVEPPGAVAANNDLAAAAAAAEEAEAALLWQMTQELAAVAPAVGQNLEAVARLDAASARSRYASACNAVRPTFVDADAGAEGWDSRVGERVYGDRRSLVELSELQHPLLLTAAMRANAERRRNSNSNGKKKKKRKGPPKTGLKELAEEEAAAEEEAGEEAHDSLAVVVPVDVLVAAGTRAVTVTGPNTGGKTATLKAFGLAALMARSGLFVPARVARLPFFDLVLADIGDGQTLLGSLSKFSARVRRTEEIVRAATPNSLVLLDEVGSGTSPQEGAALGVATLRTLAGGDGGGGAGLTLATTHHSALKVLKYFDPARFENAAVEFDDASLAPTYRVQWGIPGRSHALAVAARLGLEGAVVEAARERLGRGARSVDAVLAGMEEDRRRADAEEAEAAALEREAAELRRKARERSALESTEARERERTFAALVAREAEKALGAISNKAAEKERRSKAKAKTNTTQMAPVEAEAAAAAEEEEEEWAPTVGSLVSVKGASVDAEVLDVSSNGAAFTVRAGTLTLTVKRSQVGPPRGRVSAPPPKKAQARMKKAEEERNAKAATAPAPAPAPAVGKKKAKRAQRAANARAAAEKAKRARMSEAEAEKFESGGNGAPPPVTKYTKGAVSAGAQSDLEDMKRRLAERFGN